MTLDKVLWTLTRKRQQRWLRIMQTGTALHLSAIERLDAPMAKGSHLADLPLRIGLLQMRWLEPATPGVATSSNARLLDVDRDQTVELPTNEKSYLVFESDLASVEIWPLARPAWAKSIWRDRHQLRVNTEIVDFEWHEPQTTVDRKPGLIGRLLGKGEFHPQSPTPVIARSVLKRDLLWPPWASNLEHDRFGLVATLVLLSKVHMRLRWVPPGRFLMGSHASEVGRWDEEGPQHWVNLSSGFWVAETPCTQEQWEAVMGNNPSRFKGDALLPVEKVNWDECHEYCKVLNTQCPGLGARLPTEAEWEYACRAGTGSAYNDGSACTQPDGHDPALESLGWFDANSDSKTHPVGEKQPNAWGIHDAHGNVWEWCNDWYDDYPAQEQCDPTGPIKGRSRVIRGGCWYYQARFCRSACRYGSRSGYRGGLGFRLAAVQSSEPGKQ